MNIFNIENDLKKDIHTEIFHNSIKNRDVENVELERDYYKSILESLADKIDKKIIAYDGRIFFDGEKIKVFGEDEGLEKGDYEGFISTHNFGLSVEEVAIIINGEYYELYKFTL